ncbi:hypothetical protein I302_107570 [Kwoniella bestiolae CBS 10118]|uniref:WW domain-containing protein n=1 Tax=Kwoniella bestiolae CBS 10118 TaxID=1296100 RepID=A0A1B9FY57_9TREE|nr:hypothetical protein I302_06690 [Kwoniella bestiolae CBS 10118]OCF23707.1 hypothetical protein I302_06690 [Kwoniella bestiolae CBS 10118]
MPSPPSKQATVEDASSASPTPPPAELPESSAAVDEAVDQPIDSIGEDDQSKEAEKEEEEEWDPSSERLPGQATPKEKEKEKGKEKADGKTEEEQPWQAVWAAEQNAWYFWNRNTGEVTWTNPLDPSTSNSTQPPLFAESTSSSATYPDNSAFGGDPSQPEIDPGLAHLFGGDAGSSSAGGDPAMQKAMFNSRTGKFTSMNYEYTVGHLDEYNRAKRMGNHYFDVDGWERQKAEENERKRKAAEEGGRGERKVTKKDMERFKKKNAEKKARSQAWLRE